MLQILPMGLDPPRSPHAASLDRLSFHLPELADEKRPLATSAPERAGDMACALAINHASNGPVCFPLAAARFDEKSPAKPAASPSHKCRETGRWRSRLTAHANEIRALSK
jgi:hypothetical protein